MLALLLACRHDVAVLAEQGGLRVAGHPGPEPSIEQAFFAELDGRPGPERVFRVVTHATVLDEAGFWREAIVVYRRGQPLGEPLLSGRYPEPGYVLARDLDRDGLAELVAVGGTDATAPSALSVRSWEGGAWQERLRSPSPGVGVEIADTDGDGTLEIIGLSPGEQGVDLVVLRPDEEGLYQPGAPGDVATWLPALAAERMRGGSPRPDVELALLIQAAAERGLPPPRSAGPQSALEDAYTAADGAGDRASYAAAMGWLADPAAAGFLLRALAEPEAPRRAVAAALCRLGEGTAVLAAVRAALAAGETGEPAAELARGARDGCGAAAVASLAALAADASLPQQARAEMVFWVFREDPAFAEPALDLAASPEEDVRRSAALALEKLSAAGVPLDPARLVAGLDPNSASQGPLINALASQGAAGQPALLEVARRGSSTIAGANARIALLEMEREIPDLPQMLVEEKRTDIRLRMQHRLSRAGEEAGFLAGMVDARSRDEADIYRRALGDRAIDLGDPAWQAALARLIERARSDDPKVREAAAALLGYFDAPAAREVLAERLATDPSIPVRAAAAQSLGRLPGSEGPLLAALEARKPQMPYPDVLGALAEQGSPRALAAVEAELDGRGGDEGRHAAEALARPSGAPLLAARVRALQASSPPDCRVLLMTIIALGTADPAAGLPALEALPASCPPYKDFATALHLASGRWSSATLQAMEPALRHYTEHSDPRVREVAEAALKRARLIPP